MLQQHAHSSTQTPAAQSFVTLLILPWLLLFALNAGADTIGGRPARVLSGDSLIVIGDGGQHYTLRLAGIAAPAVHQDGGAAAMRQLRMLVLGKPVRVAVIRRGRNDTLLGRMFQGGADIGLRMLDMGMARYRTDELGNAESVAYRAAVDRARRHGLGIWSSARP